MDRMIVEKQALKHLNTLCVEIENRHPGSKGNHRATRYVREQLERFGWAVEVAKLDCLDWHPGKASIFVDGETIQVKSSPYSLPFDGEGMLVVADSFEKLQTLDITGKILLCRGELTGSQLVPQNYPFYNLEEHQKIFRILTERKPLAIIAATDRDPGGAGGISPFPWIEDGDFNIPSCYCDVATGEQLSEFERREVTVTIESERKSSWLEQISGFKGDRSKKRIVVSAHIDTKIETPGALDNATGVTVLLLLAEHLQSYNGDHCVELVFFNGEDYYDATGERYYMEMNKDVLSDIAWVANIDAAGHLDAESGLSYWNLSENAQKSIDNWMNDHEGIVPMEPWPASDHMIFAPRGIPTIVFTSTNFDYLTTWSNHTMNDTIQLVDPKRLLEIVDFLRTLITNSVVIEQE